MRPDYTIDKAEEDVRDLFCELRFGRHGPTAAQRAQVDGRTLVCSPIHGCYGSPSGWAICLEGSPPQGTLLVMARDVEHVTRPPVYFVTTGGWRWRRLAHRQLRMLLPFWRQHLRDGDAWFELPGVSWPAARTA